MEKILETVDLSEKDINRAIYIGINRTLTQIQRQLLRETSLDKKIPLKILKKRAKRHLATAKRPAASISVISTDVPVIVLNPKQNSKGVSYRGGRIKGGFINKGKNSEKEQVFKRKGRARLPIERQTVEIDDELKTNLAALQIQVNRRLEVNIINQLKRLSGAFDAS
ncbi:MAG: phage tail protein [Pseudobacteriovorax sp.]|nr:phage tail protein [Pseudobacteriovorax sp.]